MKFTVARVALRSDGGAAYMTGSRRQRRLSAEPREMFCSLALACSCFQSVNVVVSLSVRDSNKGRHVASGLFCWCFALFCMFVS